VHGDEALCSSKGFTLIELMIVVGMVGLLATIAGVRYERFIRKARQAEAKLALAGTYSLQKSFYAGI
jgi:prepilin-type N-terminal cleavage/methylation domain-containing protein